MVGGRTAHPIHPLGKRQATCAKTPDDKKQASFYAVEPRLVFFVFR